MLKLYPKLEETCSIASEAALHGGIRGASKVIASGLEKRYETSPRTTRLLQACMFYTALFLLHTQRRRRL